MEKRVWNILSYLLHPLFMPTIGTCFIISADPALLFSMNSLYTLLLIPWTVLGCTALFPLFCVFTLLKKARISNIENPSDHERLLLMLISEAGFLMSFIVLRYVPETGHSLLLFLIGINIALIINLILSSFTRASLHSTGAGGLLGTVIGMEYFTRTNLIFWVGAAAVAALLTGVARYRLKVHNEQEIYIGYLVGLLSLSLVFIAASVF